MKLQYLIILLVLTLLSCANNDRKTSVVTNLNSEKSLQSLQLIDSAFSGSMMAKSDSLLVTVGDAVLRTPEDPDSKYWKGYYYYKHALYFFLKKNNDETLVLINKGIQTLEADNLVNTDYYALLSILYGLKINFTDMIETPLIAEKMAHYAEVSLAIDSVNPRAYLAAAMLNYYAPPSVSKGLQFTIDNLTSAITLVEEQKDFSWGGNLAYFYLINLYLSTGKKDLAKEWLTRALKQYPNEKLFDDFRRKLA